MSHLISNTLIGLFISGLGSASDPAGDRGSYDPLPSLPLIMRGFPSSAPSTYYFFVHFSSVKIKSWLRACHNKANLRNLLRIPPDRKCALEGTIIMGPSGLQ